MISVCLFRGRLRPVAPPQPIFLKWFLACAGQGLSFAGSLDRGPPIFPSEKVRWTRGCTPKMLIWVSWTLGKSTFLSFHQLRCSECPAGPVLVVFFARRAIVFARYRLGQGKRCVNRVRPYLSVGVAFWKNVWFPTFGMHISGLVQNLRNWFRLQILRSQIVHNSSF